MNLFRHHSPNPKPLCPFPEAQLRRDYIDSGMTPEVYAAKRGHMVGEFSLDDYSYKDAELGKWIYRFAEIFKSPDLWEACRRDHLSESEYLEIKQYIEDLISGKAIY